VRISASGCLCHLHFSAYKLAEYVRCDTSVCVRVLFVWLALGWFACGRLVSYIQCVMTLACGGGGLCRGPLAAWRLPCCFPVAIVVPVYVVKVTFSQSCESINSRRLIPSPFSNFTHSWLYSRKSIMVSRGMPMQTVEEPMHPRADNVARLSKMAPQQILCRDGARSTRSLQYT
jgi:hypothetical protein